MNKLAPFTVKQYEYLMRCFSSWFNVAEGGKRGGKNVLQTIAFCTCLDVHPNRLHLIAGVSTATARLNILDCDGYGLANYFEGRCRTGMYQNRDCLYAQSATGEKIVLISGGGKNGDEKLIKGNTYGMAYVTEANECAQVFLQEVFDRTLSSNDRKVFHDLNPKAEGHWYYTDILDFHEQQQTNPSYGYNYGHFTIANNMSISDEQLRRVIDTYDKKSIWYQRDILGKRKQAEGLIYPMFDSTPGGLHVVPSVQRQYSKLYISNDYGTQHPCVFLLFGECNGEWYLINEYYHKGQSGVQKTADEYYADLLKFAKGYQVKALILDNAPIASSFNVLVRKKHQFITRMADNDVAHGIQTTASILKQGQFKVNDCCKNTIREFGLYSWNSKSTEDEPIKENDDTMDALRYFCQTVLSGKGQWHFV